MVPKITVGAGFRGVLDYIFLPKNGLERAEFLGGTLVGNPREMAQQAAHFRSLRPDCARPVMHISIALPASDSKLRMV